MAADSLKEQMREFNEGKLRSMKVSGADLAAEGQSGGTAEVSGTTSATVPDEAKSDVFNKSEDASQLHARMNPIFAEEKIDITEDDRNAFLQALVTGGRYERKFSLFDGKLTGVFRCRSIQESDGIIAWLSHCIHAKQLNAHIEYSTLMRNAMLAAQVKELRGLITEDFPELSGPYVPTRSDDGKEVVPPGWLPAAAAWGERPDALVSALQHELARFERRYWTMVMEAPNQNFWNPAASS